MDTEKSNSRNIRITHHRSNVLGDFVFQDVQSISAKVEKICQGKSCAGKLLLYIRLVKMGRLHIYIVKHYYRRSFVFHDFFVMS